MLMQGLYARAQHSPLEASYDSCVPYLLGEGQAVKYGVRPRSDRSTPIPRRPGPDYLREALESRLAEEDVEFDVCVQLQTDSFRMPIEDASVVWPETLSPFRPVARLRLPRQRIDAPGQRRFADVLSFNPWHTTAEHRPLGNQNRARRRIYMELSRLRQAMNGVSHLEPTGTEEFR
jgi:hypothetical protein